VLYQGQGERVKVTDAEFTFVVVHEDDRRAILVARHVSRKVRRCDNVRRKRRF